MPTSIKSIFIVSTIIVLIIKRKYIPALNKNIDNLIDNNNLSTYPLFTPIIKRYTINIFT